jgi:hypothetical protein
MAVPLAAFDRRVLKEFPKIAKRPMALVGSPQVSP